MALCKVLKFSFVIPSTFYGNEDFAVHGLKLGDNILKAYTLTGVDAMGYIGSAPTEDGQITIGDWQDAVPATIFLVVVREVD